MNRTGVIFAAEFARRMRSRPFLIGTALGAFSIVVTTLLPFVLSGLPNGRPGVVLVGEPALTSAVQALIANDYATVDRRTHLDGTPNLAFLRAEHDAADAIVIERDGAGIRAQVYAREPAGFGLTFGRDVAPLQAALATGIPVADIKRHVTVPVTVHDAGGRFASVTSARAAKGVAFLSIILLYVAILINAQVIMSSVAEEKTSRIAELLVATVEPAQLLTAKVLASGAGGLFQLLVWVLVGAVSSRTVVALLPHVQALAHPGTVNAISIPPSEIVAFFAFFLVGFAQYSVLYAAAASLINRTEDLGAVAGPVLIPVLAGFLVAEFAVAYPANPWIVACSQIPLLSPFVMFSRIATSDVPAWQIGTSLAINVAAAVGFAFLAGRIYRVGLLLYGRSPTLRQVLRALRT
jgi:ABC-2 type transport system permease protein